MSLSFPLIFKNQLTGLDCPVANERPPIVDTANGRRFDISMGGWEQIKIALQAGAREAYMSAKQDPQLLVVLLPVR